MILAALALAAAVVPPGPLDFTAQTLRTEPKERRAYLHGSVQISRGDFVVLCDDAVADFAQEKPARAKLGKGKKVQKSSMVAPGLLGSEVRHFTLDGHVRMQRGKRIAEADHGELDNEAVLRFPQLLVAPGLVAIIWSGLFDRFEPLDVFLDLRPLVDDPI